MDALQQKKFLFYYKKKTGKYVDNKWDDTGDYI